jgi:ethanolamine utilization protein EutQ (cupin superfamily)
MALSSMQKKNLNHPDEVENYGLIKKEEVVLDGVTVHRVTFDKGARWSNDLKPFAGTDSCELPHVAYVYSGRLHVVMKDGSVDEFGPNDIMMLPPGHDAWSVGDEPCVFIEFSTGADYYSQ